MYAVCPESLMISRCIRTPSLRHNDALTSVVPENRGIVHGVATIQNGRTEVLLH